MDVRAIRRRRGQHAAKTIKEVHQLASLRRLTPRRRRLRLALSKLLRALERFNHFLHFSTSFFTPAILIVAGGRSRRIPFLFLYNG